MNPELERYVARGQVRLREAFAAEFDGLEQLDPAEGERLGALANWAAIPIGQAMRAVAQHVAEMEGLTDEDRATAAWDILGVVLDMAVDFARANDASLNTGIPDRRTSPREKPLE
jgi:hypothetical protein